MPIVKKYTYDPSLLLKAPKTWGRGNNGASPWIKSWRDKLHNPKVRTLTAVQYQTWDLLLHMADNLGYLPCLRDVAYFLFTNPGEAQRRIEEMIELGFVDPIMNGTAVDAYRMHDWARWQVKKDVTQAERQQRWRDKKKAAKEP